MENEALNLDNYKTGDMNSVYKGGTGNYQVPPRKLAIQNDVGKYIDNAGFELFTDLKVPLSRDTGKINTHYRSIYLDDRNYDYRMAFIIPDENFSGFSGFGSNLGPNLINPKPKPSLYK